MKVPIAKGVFDILPRDPTPESTWRLSHIWHFLEETIYELAQSYGYREIRTPIFERTELFVRGVGESSDIVTKEMYTFEDKAGRLMTLRPEGTAAIMRAFVEKRLDQVSGCQKFFYIGPMFRYERPQAGRFRQHHQFGVEAIGDPSPEQDVEVIDLLCELYRRLGLKNLTVHLNTVGDVEARNKYRDSLRKFLQPKFDRLTQESQMRFEKNVLRILDSKDELDQKQLVGAPTLLEYIAQEDRAHFQKVQDLLKKIGIAYTLDPKLVRGLDYYNRTVFEITAGELGAQNAIGGGGRYDGLTALLGGPDLPAVGFAAGLERIIQTMLGQSVSLPSPSHPKLYLIPLGEKAQDFCFQLVFQLRHQNIAVEIDWHPKKVGKSLEKAASLNAIYALVIGDNELSSGNLKLKNLATHEEKSLTLDELVSSLQSSS